MQLHICIIDVIEIKYFIRNKSLLKINLSYEKAQIDSF
jgi:hypothetical protein